MSGKVVINKALAELGLGGSRPHLSSQEADGKRASISRLAARMGVPTETVKALVTGNAQTLARADGRHLQAMKEYLSAAAEKPGTAEKNNKSLVNHYLRAAKQAQAARVAGAVRDTYDANSIVVGTSADLAVNAAKMAGKYHLQARQEQQRGNLAGVRVLKRLEKRADQQKEGYLQKAGQQARTPQDHDVVRMTRLETEHLTRIRDRG